ncbi:MAG: acyl--CoA ligase [Clostridiales Family XIII bacterium]|jgi:acyl-CoA synthetase (AMP-forming)/AMP-acid ligase II|nr:acyl--CoA ligase [Clostridiales Family XIII bacterium]
MTIVDLLRNNAKKFPNDTALIELNPASDERKNLEWKEYDLVETGHSLHYRKELTWAGFNNLANYFAVLLKKSGIKKNNKVAILLMNSIDWLPVYFGILKTGAIAVPLNFRYTEDEIKYCLDLSDAKILIYGPEFNERIVNIKNDLKKIKHYYYLGIGCPDHAQSFEKEIFEIAEDKNTQAEIKKFPTLKQDDFAAIYFSSGTTGFPKAILHKHKNLYNSALTEQKHHSQTKDDIFLLIPPLYHTGAKMHWFGSLMSSSKAIILKGVDPHWIIEAAAKEKITIIWLLVPWASDILEVLEKDKSILKKFDLSNIRLMHMGAQPVPPALVRRWLKIFPTQKYDTDYGLSESCGPGCVHLGVDNISHIGAIGVAGYNWKTKIVDSKGKKVKQGEVGELLVKGNSNMTCYYKNKKATKETLIDNWLYTADLVREDADGFIYLVDRKKDLIITGGENIYPVQIENFFHKSDLIKDIAVIGISDERLGEIAVAIIELNDEVKVNKKIREELNAFAAALPKYKRPRKYFFDKIPRNATGKIEKPKLREKYKN